MTEIKVIIEGKERTGGEPRVPEELRDLVLGTRVLGAFDMEGATRGEKAGETDISARPDDVVELELEGGLRLWTSVKEYRETFGEKEKRGEGEPLRIGAEISAPTKQRGLFKWAVKGLKFLGVDLAEGAAERIARKIDDKKDEEGKTLDGLYGLPLSAEKLELKGEPAFPGREAPLLVFIHGTMSSTEGSFGRLWGERNDVRKRLADQYEERSYAFEHRTFTESPVENAIALAESLPQGAKLHLVSHSRGGMVGELLCRGCRIGESGDRIAPFDEEDFGLFKSAEQGKLRQLSEILCRKKFRVERFVRVACPARGTTLASGRLDRLVSLLGTGLSYLEPAGWVEDIGWLASCVLKERTDPETMPGIEAMMPTSATVRMLNRPEVKVDADLRVIAGDFDGGGVLGWLADLATEGFFSGETDVVVNTPSMYGGAERAEKKGWYHYSRGSEVWHFSYFEEKKTAKLLADGLLQESASDAGFDSVEEAPGKDDPIARGIALKIAKEGRGEPLEQRKPSPDGTRPLAVVVPGIMGTHLKAKGDRVWLDFSSIVGGKFDDLAVGQEEVRTDGAMKMAYGAFVQFLESSHETLVFPFDWRLSLRVEGRRFARYMDEVLEAAERNGRPVRIVAHSMGGLLARTAAVLEKEKGGNNWWARLKKLRGSRLVMAGTPNDGSWTVPCVLTGRDAIIKQLNLLDLRNGKEDLLRIVGAFEGLLEMLPTEGECYKENTWEKWRVGEEDWQALSQEALNRSLKTREILDRFDFAEEASFVRYVAGCAESTPDSPEVKEKKLRFRRSTEGDGRVLWATGIPRGIKSWYIDAQHGDLLAAENGFAALKEILESGETTLLSTSPPEKRGPTKEEKFMPEEAVPYLPDEGMLLRSALGMGSKRLPAGVVTRRLKVTVCHGDLMAARHPVAVGHYEGDTINSGEAVLDRRLGGILSLRNRLGIYPGRRGMAEVFLTPDCKSGAIVVGLGQVGDLTPARLSRGFADALLRFATSPSERPSEEGFSVSALLIGSGAGWGFGARESVRALVEGARQANAQLAELGGEARLAELELLELYEDRSLQALKAVRELASFGDGGEIEYGTTLRPGRGGRCRASLEEADDWWQRVRVEVTEEDELKFTSLTGLARVEEKVQPTQRALVDGLIDRAVNRPSIDAKDMAAIYNLVTPNSMKEGAHDRGDLLMVLDEAAAGYPWEMMHRGRGRGKEPLALKAGLVRQLSLKDYRERPAYSAKAKALVIADPALPVTGGFSRLAGAEREGEAVARALGGKGIEPVKCIGREAREIVGELFDDEYRILHLAGHGVYRFAADAAGKNPVTGMVIDWTEPDMDCPQGRPVLLTAVEVEQMTRVPELVFINCCELGLHHDGAEEPSFKYNLFASSLATRFIGMGVRAVIAAGWKVDDDAAKAFAGTFYESFLEGATFGEATRLARREANSSKPGSNTWAAYQCYGDPDYRFRENSEPARRKFFLTPREALCEIRALAAMGYDESGRRIENERRERELAEIEAALPHDWFTKKGEIRAALGAAWGELRKFERAVEHYETAAKCPDGGCTLKDLEQLANMRARGAADRAEKEELPADEAAVEIEKAIADLEELISRFGESGERSGLLASACKSLLMTELADKKATKKRIDELLRRLKGLYEKMAGLEGGIDPYNALNWVMAEILDILRSGTDEKRVEKAREATKKAKTEAERLYEKNPEFWSGAQAIDAEFCLKLLERLEEKATDELKNLFTGKYRKLNEDYGSAVKLDSVTKQFKFIALALPKKEAELKMELEELREALSGGGK